MVLIARVLLAAIARLLLIALLLVVSAPAALPAIADETTTVGPDTHLAHPQPISPQVLDTFDQVWTLVNDSYVYTDFRGPDWPAVREEYSARVRESTNKVQAYRRISEMVDELADEHSYFLSPQQRKEQDTRLEGTAQYVGIGVKLAEIDGLVLVGAVASGGPADRAGIKALDVLLAGNGQKLTDADDAVNSLRGPAGTTLRLTVQTGTQPPRELTITRAAVSFSEHAEARLLPGTRIAYLSIPSFLQSGIADEARDQLRQVAASGPLEGLIIDMRLNGGGLVIEGLEALQLFIDGGTLGYRVGRESTVPINIPAGKTLDFLAGKPVVVLVSEECQSMCETFSVAMRDLTATKLLGTQTGGNTETIRSFDLRDGSRLWLAVSVFERLDGSSIEGVGLTPDVVLDLPWYHYSLADDPQVNAAIRLIAGR